MLKLNPDYEIREIAGEPVLLPVGGDALRDNAIFAVNTIGMDILCYLRQPHTHEELLAYLLAQYDTAGEDLQADLRSYMDELRDARIVLEEP